MLEAKHFKSFEKTLLFLGVVSDQYLNEDHALETRVLQLYVKVLKWLDRLHFFHCMRDAEITENSILMKEFKYAAVNFFSEFSKYGIGTDKFHNLHHILPDVKEMGSLKYLSAGPSEHIHCLF